VDVVLVVRYDQLAELLRDLPDIVKVIKTRGAGF
jgi:hypothetical protein